MGGTSQLVNPEDTIYQGQYLTLLPMIPTLLSLLPRVFYMQGLRDRMNLCLWWLAVADLLYLLSVAAAGTAASLIELVDPEFSEKYAAYSMLYLSGVSRTISYSSTLISLRHKISVLKKVSNIR